MARPTEPSLPPAEPRPTGSFGSHGSMAGPPSSRRAPDAASPSERPARVQLIVALVLGLSLVAIPLYLWRRPRANEALDANGSDAAATAAVATGALGSDGGMAADDAGLLASSLPTPSSLPLGGPAVAECHDHGSKRTASAACDRLPTVEAAIQQAVTASGACFPGSATASHAIGVTYAVDVSFRRKKNPLRVSLSTDPAAAGSRSQRSACIASVKAKLASVSLTGVAHEHERYLVTMAGR